MVKISVRVPFISDDDFNFRGLILIVEKDNDKMIPFGCISGKYTVSRPAVSDYLLAWHASFLATHLAA